MGDSVEVAQFATTRGSLFRWLTLENCVFALLIAWLYHTILYRLVMQWMNDPNFSHGFFVPAFALFVIWQNRSRLRTIPIAPSWWGLPVVLFSLLTLVLGVLGVELFTSRASLVILLAGLILLSRGWPLFRAVLFPWAFLFLMIPLPAIIMNQLTFPLQIFASKLATWCLQAFFPVLREGNLIKLPHATLEVAEACSGIRSLVSLISLAIIYGYLLENRNRVRVALACAAVPIAIAANVFRIFATGMLVEYWDPEKAMGFFHEFQGWVIFVVSFLLLFTVHRAINLVWKPTAADKLPQPHPAETASPVPQSQDAATWSAKFVVTALIMFGTAAFLQAHLQGEVFPPRQPLSSLPGNFGEWSGVDHPIDEETLKVLGNGEFLLRDYASERSQDPSINLFVAYYPTQEYGDSIHTPRQCIVGSGYISIRREVVQLPGPHGAFPVNRWVAAKGLERNLVLYWFQAHGREVPSEYAAKYYLIHDSIRLRRSDGGLVRLLTPMYPNESPDAAQARIMKLGDQIVPLLDQYIPR
jgi:exosortase D (VPLPA-CTERM-specific)